MKDHIPRLLLILASIFFLNSCGTRDYPPAPSNSNAPREGQRAPPSSSTRPKSEMPQPLVTKEDSPGYLWGGIEWIGVSDETVAQLKCNLKDGPMVSEFKVFGSAIMGGAILGIVIRNSGSWFFGKPPEPASGHWFWNRLDETVKTAGEGGFRGAVLGGLCETLLAGGNFTPLAGVLGQSFAALSGAITLGGMTSMAAAPYIKRWMSEENTSAVLNQMRSPHRDWRAAKDKIINWSKTSDIGKGLRYGIAPGLTILGIGSGAGLIVYDWLQTDDDYKTCTQTKPLSH